MTTTWTRALVTGASSGIGREMARLLAAAGTDLVIVARDGDRLAALADDLGGEGAESAVAVEVLAADLSDAGDLARVAERISDDEAPIDLLVNNAGLGFAGPFIDVDDAADELTVAVNVVALHRLCRAAATTMAERGSGTILNVSSIAGDVPGPGSATYNATKAFVSSLSQSMHSELRPKGVTVTALCPGLTRTEFQERAGVGELGMPDFAWQSAEEVARTGLDAAADGKAIVVAGAVNKVVSRAVRSLPRGLARELVRLGGRGR